MRTYVEAELMSAANPPLREVTGFLDDMAATGQIPVTSERLTPSSSSSLTSEHETSLMNDTFAGMSIDARPPPGKIRR